MKPFLKWAGGKRWLARLIQDQLPLSFDRYIEPFLGSGAVFFQLLPKKAILSDANAELVAAYRTVRDSPDLITTGLARLHRAHTAEVYYSMRSCRPEDPVDAAVRFIYLNRTCWNGLYRVNRLNEFNVPLGTKTSVILPDDDFKQTSLALRKATLLDCDFEATIDNARSGDLIYADPPYTVRHNHNGFLKYNQTIFSWEDQIRLRDALLRARKRGCHIVMSNADHESIRNLYRDFGARSIPRASILAGSREARGPTAELLVIHHG